MTIRCPGCDAEITATASICVECRGTLERALVNVAAYHHDLDTIRAGQVRFGGSGGSSRGGDAKLGMNPTFAAKGRGSLVELAVRNTIVGWTRYVLEQVPPVHGPVCATPCLHMSCSAIRKTAHPRDTIASCCAYLLRFSDWLRVSAVGAEVLADVTSIEDKLRRMVDRPAEQWYAGECGSERPVESGGMVRCTRELRATRQTGTVTCGSCGATYDVAARRAVLLAEAEDREASVGSIVTFVRGLGDGDVSEARMESRISTWVDRDRLKSHGKRVVNGRPRPVYRIGDVLDLLGKDAG